VQKDYQISHGVVRKETAMDVTFDFNHPFEGEDKIFTVTTDKCRRYARAVVLALGPRHLPIAPETQLDTAAHQSASQSNPPQTCHSSHARQIPDKLVQHRIDTHRNTHILVVGGGLTSAQITDLAIRRGVTTVYHLMRGPCRVKPFDVDLKWMSKYRNPLLAQFWSADSDEERHGLIGEARGGGSITPIFHKKLVEHQAVGRLVLQPFTRLTAAKFTHLHENGADHGGYWEAETDPPMANLPLFDFIYFATGMSPDFESFPCLRNMITQHPVDHHGGLPCVNNRLMWNDDVPLFVTGALAGLRVGPGAGNLGGAKIAAERIGLEIERMGLGRSDAKDGREDEEGEEMAYMYSVGLGNKFRSLSLAE
jgi:cation diffusion facilitator CzcD-associated flavoprotein CzcO